MEWLDVSFFDEKDNNREPWLWTINTGNQIIEVGQRYTSQPTKYVARDLAQSNAIVFHADTPEAAKEYALKSLSISPNEV